MTLPKVESQYFPLAGGLDLVTPQISLSPGKLFGAQNYEPEISGGYSRIDGFERYDGRTKPSDASYWVMTATITGTIAVGNTVTGLASSATGKVLSVVGTKLVLGRVTGTFQVSEALQVAAVTQATSTSLCQLTGESDPSNDADYMLLAANDVRNDILVVPGSGPIRGVAIYADNVYAFRDNVGATAGTMWKATSGGWSQIVFNSEISFGALTLNSAVTMTIAAPCVVSWAAHPFVNGQAIVFATTGALPSGLSIGTVYYIINAAAGTFQLAAYASTTPITTTGTQSGTHTATAVGNTITAGSTITGVTSGATATVKAALLRTGSWTTSPVGTLVISGITGTFNSNEAIKVSGVYLTQTASLATTITRLPGGALEYVNANFTGSTATQKLYGCDGVNPAFEFDGTTYVPIHTGMAADTPYHIMFHRFYLFLSFLGSVQYSAIGAPYSWTIVLGAGEIALGDYVTGFIPQGGNNAGSTLGIFTKNRTYMLYGSSSANFNLVASVFELGYSAYTMQPVSNNTYGLTARGVQGLITTLTYGDFDYESISFPIQPLMFSKRGMETASCSLRAKDQYRLFFNDGTGIVMGLTGDKTSGILPIDYGKIVRCMTTQTLTTGKEVTLFGSDDGYVYQDNIGTSFDGSAIEAWIRPAFNHSKSPRTRKRYRRAVFEVKPYGFSKVDISYDLGYASQDILVPVGQTNNAIFGGGYWDQFTWDQFTWDAKTFNDISMSLTGTEKNISFIFYSNRAQDKKHTVQGVTLQFTQQRNER